MAHKHDIDDTNGDVMDRVYFCGDYCHRSWCQNQNVDYAGWDGCHELEFDTPCDSCGDTIPGVEGPYVY
tara:strand:- start:248 stop:454 length:207 start_codon:yes stop_codon:yes gene_type:complete